MNTFASAWRLWELGWPLFPCMPRTKKPALAPLKADGSVWRKGIDPIEERAHRGGFHLATTNASAIAAYEQENPNYNVAVRLGERHRLTMVEADDDAGTAELNAITRSHKPTVAFTSRRGINRLYAGCIDLPERPVRNLWPETFDVGVEFKNGLGFFVAPASIHPAGPTYRFLPGQAPWECELQPLPEIFADEVRRLDLIRLTPEISHNSHPSHSLSLTRDQRSLRVTRYLERVATGLADGRKQAAYALSAALVTRLECSEREAAVIVVEWNRCNLPPLTDSVLQRQMSDAFQYAPRRAA